MDRIFSQHFVQLNNKFHFFGHIVDLGDLIVDLGVANQNLKKNHEITNLFTFCVFAPAQSVCYYNFDNGVHYGAISILKWGKILAVKMEFTNGI